MRKVADIKIEKDALHFWAFLKRKGIEASYEKVSDDNHSLWEIWVDDEDNVSSALKYLEEFSENPQNEKFLISPRKIKEIDTSPKQKKSNFKVFNLSEKWHRNNHSTGLLTLSIIIFCIAVFLLSGMGKNTEVVGVLFISERMDGGLTEILSGQFWRIITPVFLHFNYLHIIFNLLWLNNLGSQIEKRKGTKFLLSFLLVTAALSNLTQFLITGPAFGGMSGVVYGLFGYVWIKSRLDPADGFHIDQTISFIMFGFFFFCFTGLFGGIANWAHAGGLLTGLAWGYGSAYRWNRGKG